VRKLLGYIEKRAEGNISLGNGKGKEKDGEVLRAIEEGLARRSIETKHGKAEEVVMKATGRAIERLLQLAIWFQGQDDCVIRIRTGSVGTVDDVVAKNSDVDRAPDGEEEVEIEESRVRRTSSLEVWVGLR